jgi:monoamine oxidase
MSKRITEVVVIGAGVAGLACAQALCQAGLRVRILEARNRIAGRTRGGIYPWSASGGMADRGAR